MTITLQGEYTDLNTFFGATNRNRYIGAKIKRTETERVVYEVMQAKTPKVTTYPIYIHFHWFAKNRKKDPDNISSAKKFILDGLQEAGIIENDGWNQIAGFSDDFTVDKKNPRVVVEIII